MKGYCLESAYLPRILQLYRECTSAVIVSNASGPAAVYNISRCGFPKAQLVLLSVLYHRYGFVAVYGFWGLSGRPLSGAGGFLLFALEGAGLLGLVGVVGGLWCFHDLRGV